MNQQAIDSIKAERDAAVREREAMAKEIEHLIHEMRYIAGISNGQVNRVARAALKETK